MFGVTNDRLYIAVVTKVTPKYIYGKMTVGNVNRASKCKGVYNSIYCGDDNDIHLAVSAERICENE